jgi:hypothetical protein
MKRQKEKKNFGRKMEELQTRQVVCFSINDASLKFIENVVECVFVWHGVLSY